MVKTIGKGILAGIMATIAMTVIMGYVAPMVGLPQLGVMRRISHLSLDMKLAVVLVYCINRVVFLPLIYVFGARKILPGSGLVKGLIFGVGLWAFIRFVVIPFRGGDIFAINNPEQMGRILVSLIGNMIYGVIIGKISR